MAQRREQAREVGTGVNQQALLRVGSLAFGVGAIVVASVGLLIEPEIVVPRQATYDTGLERELLATLRELRAAWDPRERRRILDEAPERCDFVGPLQRLLRIGETPLLPEAVRYAGATRDVRLRDAVVALVESAEPKLRGVAIRSAEKLGMWSEGDLRAFLGDDEVGVRQAALDVIANRPVHVSGTPWDGVTGVLESTEPALQAAARRALRKAPDPVVRGLFQRARIAAPATAEVMLEVLAQAGFAAKLEKEIVTLLQQREELLHSCLELLTSKRAPLLDAGPIWELVEEEQNDMEVRVQALLCLESNGGSDLDRVRRNMFGWEPRLRYHAARCLLAGGDEKGALVLLDMVGSEDEAAALASRRLLAWLTGRSTGSTRDAFAGALKRGVARNRSNLPKP